MSSLAASLPVSALSIIPGGSLIAGIGSTLGLDSVFGGGGVSDDDKQAPNAVEAWDFQRWINKAPFKDTYGPDVVASYRAAFGKQSDTQDYRIQGVLEALAQREKYYASMGLKEVPIDGTNAFGKADTTGNIYRKHRLVPIDKNANTPVPAQPNISYTPGTQAMIDDAQAKVLRDLINTTLEQDERIPDQLKPLLRAAPIVTTAPAESTSGRKLAQTPASPTPPQGDPKPESSGGGIKALAYAAGATLAGWGLFKLFSKKK